EDADRDGAWRQDEVLLGRRPGDPHDRPTRAEIATLASRRERFQAFLTAYRWRPYEPVRLPAVPRVRSARWVRNPIDTFIAAEYAKHHLKPRPEAPKLVLLRRVYLDLIGLSPTAAEQRAFLTD